MARLKYYDKENATFKEEYANRLNNIEARYIYKRLANRYHLHQGLSITSASWGGNCSRFLIKVCDKPPIAILAHEIAHGIHWKKRQRNERWHCKKHEKIMRRVLRAIEKNLDEWKGMANKKADIRAKSLEHRIERKEEKKNHSKTNQCKLDRTAAGIKRWTTKKKRAENALKKLNRRKKLYERLLVKSQQSTSSSPTLPQPDTD